MATTEEAATISECLFLFSNNIHVIFIEFEVLILKNKSIFAKRKRDLSYIAVMIVSVLVLSFVAALLYNYGTHREAAAGDVTFRTEEVLSKRGSYGNEVTAIQKKLKNWGYYTGSVDGIYGSRTEAAVRYFQRKNGLVVDGIAGKKTLAAMGIQSSSSTSSGGSAGGFSSGDINLIARAVYGEARGEPYTGQVAVAAVILNRVRDSRFPKTVAGVVYQSGAFDVVADGQINLTPNDTAYKAARDAINGWDPTYGCLYYYNPRTATNQWIRSLPISTTIGSHVFCRAK